MFFYCMECCPLKSKNILLTINKVICNYIYYNVYFCFFIKINLWCIVLLDPADITYISGNQTVNKNEEVTLNCSAKGTPKPNITWTRVSDNSPVSFPLTITGKQDEGGYKCTADNGIGNPASQVVYVVVESKLYCGLTKTEILTVGQVQWTF